MGPKRLAITCAVAALLLAAPAAVARPAEPLGFGLRAVGQPKGWFDLSARPGATVGGRLLVTNTTRRARTVHLRPADARTAAAGGLDYGRQGRRPTGDGRWIELPRGRVRLPASGAAEVPFSVRVPRGARAGDHLAGILAFGRPPKPVKARGNFRLRFFPRMAMAVQVRVPGPRMARLELRGAGIRVAPTGAVLGLRLANTGNTLVRRSTGTVTVLQKGRPLFRRKLRIDSFVPGTAITYPVPWLGRPVEGDYEVRVRLKPAGARLIRATEKVEFGSKRIREFRRETGRSAAETGPSTAMYVLLMAALAAVAGLLAAYLRLLRRVR